MPLPPALPSSAGLTEARLLEVSTWSGAGSVSVWETSARSGAENKQNKRKRCGTPATSAQARVKACLYVYDNGGTNAVDVGRRIANASNAQRETARKCMWRQACLKGTTTTKHIAHTSRGTPRPMFLVACGTCRARESTTGRGHATRNHQPRTSKFIRRRVTRRPHSPALRRRG